MKLDRLCASYADVLRYGAAALTKAPVDLTHCFKAAETLAQAEALLMMLEGTIALEFIVVIPTENVVNLCEPLVITELLGDRLDFFEYPKPLLVPALHPQHPDLGLAEYGASIRMKAAL